MSNNKDHKDKTIIESFINKATIYYNNSFYGCLGLVALGLFIYRALYFHLPAAQIILEFCVGCCCSPCYVVYALILISKGVSNESSSSSE